MGLGERKIVKIGAKLKMTEAAIRSGLDGIKQRRIWQPQFWEEELLTHETNC